MILDKQKQLKEIFLTQAGYCEELGSPFMVRLCRLFAEHLVEDHAGASYLLSLNKPESFWSHALALRVAGALHALVLSDKCEVLKSVYPPYHLDVTDDAMWKAVSHAMQTHSDFFIPYLNSAPQTNEVRRSSVLLPGFITIAEKTGLPLTLSELGASAGINLCWDCFGYKLDSIEWGNADGGVFMAPEWKGAPPPEAREILILDRGACDLAPVDYQNAEEKLHLLSYIWADQEDRFERTENALSILTENKYTVDKADISQWLPDRLAMKWQGSAHVIYHTIAWQYQGETACRANQALIEEAGSKASTEAPLAWLRFEPDGQDPGAAITLTLWPDGTEYTLGRADYHGRWIHWIGLDS